MATSTPAPPPTVLRNGRYRVERLLGEGSQGQTFGAIDAQDGTHVAIKRFQVRGAKSWKDVELAEREAHVLSSLQHPSIPRYRDHFEEDGALFLVTDYIDGENLASLRRHGVRFTETDVLHFLRDASVTLAYLHERVPPVIHRDIKPGNVIRRADGSFALIDFGSVRDRMKPEGGSTVVGTFGFMAPEQFQGRAMPGSDVYAVGATAMALITGREPEELPHKGLAIDVRAALAGSNVRPALVEALASMLDPNPDQRPSSLAPVIARLDAPAPSAPHVTANIPPASRAGAPPWGNWDKSWLPANAQRAINRAERRVARAAERAERRAARAGRRGGWTTENAAERQREFERGMERMRTDVARMRGFPRLITMFAITMALVAVTVALRAVVPIVLRLLSLILGKPLREAADSVSRAGETTANALQKTLDSFNAVPPPWQDTTQPPATRVDTTRPAPGVRVEVESPQHAAEVEVPRAGESADHQARRERS